MNHTDFQFLEKVLALFWENGAKALTMDDIAKEFGISKKTLYQKYRNKEALLEDVLALQMQMVMNKMNRLQETFENPVERLLCRNKEFDEMARSNQSLFIRQLTKYYPEIFEKHTKNFFGKFSEILKANVKEGRALGYYRDDFDENIYARFFFYMAMSYDSTHFPEDSGMDRVSFNSEVVRFYMNAIVTDKGRDLIEKLNKQT